MSQMKNYTNNIYSAKVFFPLILGMALLLGAFQNCSSRFDHNIDYEKNQIKAQEIGAVILTEQALDITRLEGSAANFSVPIDLFADQGLKTCPTATYNWSFQPVAQGASRVSLSETASILQIPNTTLSEEGAYYVDVICNGQNYSLGPVNLDVVPKLRLVNSSVGDRTVNEGGPIDLNAQFEGPNPISYQWHFQPSSGGASIALAGETSQTLNIPNAALSDQGDYTLVATSNEGGFSQTVKAGPGRVTVLSMSSVTGSVSGTTRVLVGEPINLTSQVSGAASPQYQWYHNSVPITGATDATFSIPQSQLSDTGVYALSVNDNGQNYQIGSVHVVVECSPGQYISGQQCTSVSKVCSVENGAGIQFLDLSGVYGECLVSSCDPGYINLNNQCTTATSECDVENGKGRVGLLSNGQPGECVVYECDAGYININNSCEKKTCPIPNGVGTFIVDGDSLRCELKYCDADYVALNGKCESRRRSCSVPYGVGVQIVNESGVQPCQVSSCDPGYANINNSCQKKDCPIANGAGSLALGASGNVECRVTSCNPGYIAYNNRCVTQACEAAGGTGHWVNQSGQMVCSLTACKESGHVILNNRCVSSICPLTNGTGAVALDTNGATYCKPVGCDPGYVIQGNQCEPTQGQSCPIANGFGELIQNPACECTIINGKKVCPPCAQAMYCQLRSCNQGYVPYNNKCVLDKQSCDIQNGTGYRKVTSSGYGQCVVSSCNSGYLQEGNSCVPEIRTCSIANGTGIIKQYANGISECMVQSCNSGYGKTITQQCLPLEKPCYIGSGQGVQRLTSYGYSSCKINSCPSGSSLVMGVCQTNESLLCEPTDSAKSAYGGKVYGHIFSLLNNKYNANIYTATASSNRLNGQVYFKSVSFSGNKGHLRDVGNQVVRHSNGEGVKDWFGLELYTQILPPDGAQSGNYIFALASEDGSALFCKTQGSWSEFISPHTPYDMKPLPDSACSAVLRSASLSVNISRDKPMPIKIKYFQNGGSGRCLRLYYKRAGSAGDFKVVPQNYLILPDNTINRCPNTTY